MEIKDAVVFGRLRKWPVLFWKHKAPELRYTFRALKMVISSALTLPFRIYEGIRFKKAIQKTKIEKQPIFILGFWRSGTTYLQNLLCQDYCFGYVSLLHVLAPEFFLSTEKLLTQVCNKFIPKTRPMDNVELSMDAPQEEELALFNLTNSSLYHQLFFPKEAYNYFHQWGLFKSVPANQINDWRKIYLTFLKKITFYHKGKQLILKNPTNTGRIKELLGLFPNAKFIHIHRNPYDVYVSCVHMFKKLMPLCQLQSIAWKEMDKYILYIYKEMMQKYFKEKNLIPSHNLIDVEFSQLKIAPVEMVEKIYRQLDIGCFQEVKQKMAEYIKQQESYKQNQFSIDTSIYKRVNTHWDFVFDELGYKKVTS